MQARSWMAAWTPAAAVALAFSCAASPARAGDAAVVNKVTMRLTISGLGSEGCKVEIKPGHPACTFKPITKELKEDGRTEIKNLEVSSSSPDRDCMFAIVVTEPGQPPKTLKRGLRLSTPSEGKPVPMQTFDCLLRSPSLAAKTDAAKTIK
jgi:hypothetical protein